ncbi:ABC transporter ATP-binding protein/permease [Salinisphaera sp. P385]|uniref:ABC transporter ATP-binding protein/permease n=1 Tax=Spectribacter acetivorans TaxID=3075603 RepID=A0ABU3B855_9GAMM|nr:ABC transporter ATP-binding protein/permease [Salinisphaera sp. P385]MDT0618657.1 ABC transporter ATP-binding protein/permease [Salinisphaera sp. P385]
MSAPDTTHREWRRLRLLVPYLWEFRGRVAIALAFLVAAKLATVTLPIVLKRIVDSLDASQQDVIVLPLAMLVVYGVLRLSTVLLGELRDLIFGRVTERAMRRLALRAFEHLHGLNLDFHLARRTGGLSRDIERGTAGISFLLRFMLFNILPTLLEIGLVVGILLFYYDWFFAAIVLVSVVLYIVSSAVLTEWRTRHVRESNRLDSEANTRAMDSLLNYETVKYFGNEGFEAGQYDRFLASWEQALRRSRLSLGLLNVVQALIIGAAITAMMILAARQVVDGAMTVGDLVMINAYMLQLFLPLNFLGFVYREIKRALADISRMFQLLDVEPGIADAPHAAPLVVSQPAVRFDNVSFGYRPDRPILRNVSFEIPAGRKIAVVGASGAGKSTLARLLFRFYDVDDGAIAIDGSDIRDIAQASLREAIGVVPQDTVLFNETIEYNIRYGRPDAGRDAVERVARLAHLDAFIAALPEGYDTMVGERGLKLSGGEKQRIAIARTMLKDPAILIFDEATSSLDSHAERAILDAMRDVAADRTTLVIAHRLSTVIDADEIIVMAQGRVAERGTHPRLLSADGRYAAMWRLQQERSPEDSAADPRP